MIVYVESNFALELALNQEQSSSAEIILSLAEQGQFELAIPSFAISEPFSTLMYREGRRSHLYRALDAMLKESVRSYPLKQTVADIRVSLEILEQAHDEDPKVLQRVFKRIVAVGRPLETTLAVLEESHAYQDRFELAPQDAIIYAAVVGDLRTRPAKEKKCFLSRDKKAFSKEDAFEEPTAMVARHRAKHAAGARINNDLKQYNCQYFGNFDNALRYIHYFKDQDEATPTAQPQTSGIKDQDETTTPGA